MKARDDGEKEAKLETNGRREIIVMHLFDEEARDEEAICETEASVHHLTTVQDYIERRVHDLALPTVCEGCKDLAAPFAENLSRDLAAEGLRDEAEEYRQLLGTLRREVGRY